MAALSILSVSFVFLIWFPDATGSTRICQMESCQWAGPRVHFPFRLRESNQSNLCGYDQGFELLCSEKGQTLLPISNAGNFLVKGISLEDQKVWINDPDLCLPRRFLNNLDLTATHFRFSDEYSLVNLSFFNCPSSLTDTYPGQPINCLRTSRDDNYSVIALLPDSSFPTWISSCQFISSAFFPTIDTPRWIFWNRIYADVELQWSTPDCKHCQGGLCGFSRDEDSGVACYGDKRQGLSRKYVIGLCLGIPGLIVLIVLAYMFRRKVNWGGLQRPQQPRTELSGTNIPQPVPVAIGLDVLTIEKYPITQLDESASGIQLPNPTDNICSICLCEYQPRETLRTIPQCNHYFHVSCIDGWLKMNATCPLCRKLPARSSSLSLTNS
ncbi:hypothetical protein L6164_028332 [Bauhinia variegata]|uniref:Uncharacterized protein n=1 Tax=Bauhinia variegata TaxID=167791 RepID=A0ACB9LW26_BAUVA|nr:hypothetical protein L6164_028332 [Bauhinia variegata]